MLKRALLPVAFVAAIIGGGVATNVVTTAIRPQTAAWEVYFSPHDTPAGSPTAAIVSELGKAKSTVRVLAYGFTSEPIAAALIAAHGRGVDVQVILDRDANQNNNRSQAILVASEGIPVFLDGKHAIAHNKVLVIDGQTLITGSFNLTFAAEHANAENLLVVRSKDVAARYIVNWNEHRTHAVPFK